MNIWTNCSAKLKFLGTPVWLEASRQVWARTWSIEGWKKRKTSIPINCSFGTLFVNSWQCHNLHLTGKVLWMKITLLTISKTFSLLLKKETTWAAWLDDPINYERVVWPQTTSKLTQNRPGHNPSLTTIRSLLSMTTPWFYSAEILS